MAATLTEAPSRTTPATGASPLTGTAKLVRLLLRRDRIKLSAWAGGTGLLMLYLVAAVPAAYGTEEDLQAIGATFHDPVSRLLIGPGYGLTDPSIERFVANGYGLYVLLLVALMSILLVTRHTRVEEQTGRAELVRANVVGPRAALTATLVVALITNVVAAVLVFVVVVGVGGFGVGGSALFATGVATLGLAFAGLTALTVQLTE
jgi:ABC-2 type transport system permease protein